MNKYLILTLLPFTSTLMADQIYDSLAALQTDLQSKIRASNWNNTICYDNRPSHGAVTKVGGGYVTSMVLSNSTYVEVVQNYLNANRVASKEAYSPVSTRTDIANTGDLTIYSDSTSFESTDVSNSFSTTYGVQSSFGIGSNFILGSYEAVSTTSLSTTTGSSRSTGASYDYKSTYVPYRGARTNYFWQNRYRLDQQPVLVPSYTVDHLTYTLKCTWVKHGRHSSRVIPENFVVTGPGIPNWATAPYNKNNSKPGMYGLSLGLATDTFKVKTKVNYQLDYVDPWPVVTTAYDSGYVYYSGQSEQDVRTKYGIGNVPLYVDPTVTFSWYTKP